jgi:hypothetical protein
MQRHPSIHQQGIRVSASSRERRGVPFEHPDAVADVGEPQEEPQERDRLRGIGSQRFQFREGDGCDIPLDGG